MSQILGVTGVLAGVLISLAPVLGNGTLGGQDVILNSVLFGCSSLFIAFAIVLKEIALNGRPRKQKAAPSQTTESNSEHRGETPAPSAAAGLQATRTFDIFVVNSFSSLMQMVATTVLLPVTLLLTPVPGGGWLYIRTGLQMLFRAKYMPWLTLLYIACNVIFNVCALTLMKQASSTVVLISSICAVPLVSLVFCLPLPMLTPSPFSWMTCFGLFVVMFGVCVYNIAPAPRRS
jgi:CRT-like, chloroquine-resistance transporter-like